LVDIFIIFFENILEIQQKLDKKYEEEKRIDEMTAKKLDLLSSV